jgi:hypothetical protein
MLRKLTVVNATRPAVHMRRRRRSSTDMLSALRVPLRTAFQPWTASSPPTRRNSSIKTGPYSIQCPSASMIGWSSRALIRAAESAQRGLLVWKLR